MNGAAGMIAAMTGATIAMNPAATVTSSVVTAATKFAQGPGVSWARLFKRMTFQEACASKQQAGAIIRDARQTRLRW
jgi:hypothetical protein